MSLYPPPQLMQTELFTSVPDEFRFPDHGV